MESQRKNNLSTPALFIDKEAVFALLLCQEGLLTPVNHLMNEKEMHEVDNTGLFEGQSFPFSFILAPAGKRNEQVMKESKRVMRLPLFVKIIYAVNYLWILLLRLINKYDCLK